MHKTQYKHPVSYKESIELVWKFMDDVLRGDISMLQTLCFDDITEQEYIGDIDSGSSRRSISSFEATTMNSFGSLIGKENDGKGRSFAYRAKFFGTDKDEALWNKILKFKKLYHPTQRDIQLLRLDISVLEERGGSADGAYFQKELLDTLVKIFKKNF